MKDFIKIVVVVVILFLAGRAVLQHMQSPTEDSAATPDATEQAKKTSDTSPASKPAAQVKAPAPSRVIVLTKDMAAFDSQTSTQQIGTFLSDSMLSIMGPVNPKGMYPVEFRDPSGKVISACCKKEEIDPYLGITSAPSSSSTPINHYQLRNSADPVVKKLGQ